MDRADVERWLADYVEAWKSYDRGRIAALFTEDASYRYHPFDEPIVGAEAIVESWFDEPDEPGTYDAAYEPYAVDGDRAVAVGSSSYRAADGSIDRIYDNCYLLRFAADGRCAEFTEFFIRRPDSDQ